MKFMFHLVPTGPASPEERERLAPIAHRTEKIQKMLDVMKEQMERFGTKIIPELM